MVGSYSKLASKKLVLTLAQLSPSLFDSRYFPLIPPPYSAQILAPLLGFCFSEV